jgi:hypothetical protein
MRCLPARFGSLDEAKDVFESTRGAIARWCFIALHENNDEPQYVLSGKIIDESGRSSWRPLGEAARAAPATAPKTAPSKLQEERLLALLTPPLGFFTAEQVARQVCARFQSADLSEASQADQLREFLRNGLLAFMEASAAEALAAKCTETA